MACNTQEEIGERENVDRTIISDMAKDFVEIGNLAENHKASASHATDFDLPIYNIWKQQTKSEGSSHFGNRRSTLAQGSLLG